MKWHGFHHRAYGNCKFMAIGQRSTGNCKELGIEQTWRNMQHPVLVDY